MKETHAASFCPSTCLHDCLLPCTLCPLQLWLYSGRFSRGGFSSPRCAPNSQNYCQPRPSLESYRQGNRRAQLLRTTATKFKQKDSFYLGDCRGAVPAQLQGLAAPPGLSPSLPTRRWAPWPEHRYCDLTMALSQRSCFNLKA